jgi:hypothetical protein
MLINVTGWMTRNPFAKHHRNRALLRVGTRMPGPANESIEEISDCKSTFYLISLNHPIYILVGLRRSRKPASQAWGGPFTKRARLR